MTEPRSDAFVLFGATGDLAHKKTFAALYAMVRRGHLKEPVVGVAIEDWEPRDPKLTFPQSHRTAQIGLTPTLPGTGNESTTGGTADREGKDMRRRYAIFAAVLIMAPLGAKAADARQHSLD